MSAAVPVVYRGTPVAHYERDESRQRFLLFDPTGEFIDYLYDDQLIGAPNGPARQASTQNNSGPAGPKSPNPGPGFPWTPRGFTTIYASATNSIPESLEEPIPYEGIRAGEIVAWRLWIWDSRVMFLRSLAIQAYWKEDGLMEGEPGVGDAGVYSFKERRDVEYYGYGQTDPIVVLGTVSIWGDIIECERGYKSQFAKIRSLNAIRFWPPKVGTDREDSDVYLTHFRKIYNIK